MNADRDTAGRLQLSPSRLVNRGFRRFGIVVAGILLIIGMSISAYKAADYADKLQRDHESFLCAKKALADGRAHSIAADRSLVDGVATGCVGATFLLWSAVSSYDSPPPVWLASFARPFSFGLAITVFVAAVLFALVWCTGWIVSGFLRD